MILTEMEGPNGHTFDEALQKAKEMGIVEKDESLDIDGYDAAVKLRALLVVFSNSSEGCQILVPSIDDIHRDSIRNITREDIQRAYNDDRKKYRLVATAGKTVEPLFGYNII
jgi:homoserine dehydrogenase